MYRIFAIIALLVVNTSGVTYDSKAKIVSSLDASFKQILGSLTGNKNMLFGNGITFKGENCCAEKEAFANHPPRVDLVIALDKSGSVNSKDFDIQKSFAEEIVSRLVVSYSATRVAIITWSGHQTLEFDFNKYINYDGVIAGIKKIKQNGGKSAIGDALNFINTNVFSQSPGDAKKVLLFITDGSSNFGYYRVSTQGFNLKRSGVKIFAIGIGKEPLDSELGYMGTRPLSKHRFRLRTFSDLLSVGRDLSKTDCKNSATVYDACGRKCTCKAGKLANCTRIRKSFLEMTELERCRYIRAIKKASRAPFKAEYDKFIKIHVTEFFSGIHVGRYFLPWHRWYNLEYENILRKVDCRVTVPYWEWSLDSENPFSSDVWNSDLCKHIGFGGNGSPLYVKTGPFACPEFQLTPSASNPCLKRYFNGEKFPSCTIISGTLDIKACEFPKFLKNIEKTVHDPIHFRISGSFCGIRSSNAPIFFVHHTFIDKLWGDWQDKGIEYKQKEYYHNNTKMPGTVYSPRDVYDLNNLPNYVKVSYEQPKQGCKLPGVGIVAMSDIANMTVQERFRLDPNPLPPVPKQIFKLFGMSDSDINGLSEVQNSTFGTAGKITDDPFSIPGCDITPDDIPSF